MATRDQIAQLQVHRHIAEVAGRRARRAKAKIPPLRDPRAETMGYLVGLRKALAELERVTRDVLIAGLPRIVSLLPEELRLDGAADDQLRQDMDLARVEADPFFDTAAAGALAEAVGKETAVRHRREFGRQMTAAVGFDPFVADPNLPDQLDGFIADNVALIKSLGSDQLSRVEGIIQRGLRAGLRHEVIAKQIRDTFGIARRRAAFIARDQVSKLYGQLTRSRHQQVGITKYRWSTSRDERVRPGHRQLEGTIQSWKHPPVTNPRTGGRAHPREDPNCRCEPIPVVEELLEQLGMAAPAAPAAPRAPRPFPAQALRPVRRIPEAAGGSPPPPRKPPRKDSIRTRAGVTKALNVRQQAAEQSASWLRQSRRARETASFEQRSDWYNWEWVHGSNRKTSVLMKHAVRLEFGATGAAFSRGIKFKFDPRDITMARSDMRAIFEETQRGFRESGVATVRLYRGYRGKPPARNALESWTSDAATARKFAAKSPDGQVLVQDVPVEQILAHHKNARWVDGIWGRQDEYLVMW